MSSTRINKKAQRTFALQYFRIASRTDRMFAVLLLLEWAFAVALALLVTPTTWTGSSRAPHLHLYAAILLGGAAAVYPAYLVYRRAGRPLNRYVIAVAQMTFSTLFIHLTGGRIETHFHMFGSLAFLAFYKVPGPMLLATAFAITDHIVRGYYWPESVYGASSASLWRAIEHAGWLAFEDVFLLISIRNGMRSLRSLSDHQARLEIALAGVALKVRERTQALVQSREIILDQQLALVSSAKMSALGEMAGGIAHEINNPLTIIQVRIEQIAECAEEGELTPEFLRDSLQVVGSTTQRISRIVTGLRSFARDTSRDPWVSVHPRALVDETFGFCGERFHSHGVRLEFDAPGLNAEQVIECRPTEISQVLLNLLNNAFDAVQARDQRWVRVETLDLGERVEIRVTDSGDGIPEAIRDKLMQPFFTTKEIGKGTGLGLSISQGIVQAHRGTLTIDTECPNTRFVITLPKRQTAQVPAAA